MNHAERCRRAAEIVRDHGAIELIDVEFGDVGIHGPEFEAVFTAAGDASGPLAEAVAELADSILFAANAVSEPRQV